MWTPFGSIIAFKDSLIGRGVCDQRTSDGLQYRWVFLNGQCVCGVFQDGRIVRRS